MNNVIQLEDIEEFRLVRRVPQNAITDDHLTGVQHLHDAQHMEGSARGPRVTEPVETPNGDGAWCEYEYVPGMLTVLTLDESALSAGFVVTFENPQTYLVPENPGGLLGPV